MEKRMVVTEVMKNLKVGHIGSDSPPSVDSGSISPVHTVISRASRDSSLARSGASSESLQRQTAPSNTGRGLRRSKSTYSGQSAGSADWQSSLQSISANNPLLAPSVTHTAPPQISASDRDTMHELMLSSATTEMQSVARQITLRCLRRWDGVLGIRAGSDGLGRRSGIWRDKFDGVHYAVLLLTMRKLNETLTTSSSPSEHVTPAAVTTRTVNEHASVCTAVDACCSCFTAPVFDSVTYKKLVLHTQSLQCKQSALQAQYKPPGNRVTESRGLHYSTSW